MLNSSLSWSEEAQIFGHIWIVFLGIPIAYRRGAHLYIETFRDMLPRGAGAAFDLLIELIWAAFAVVADDARLPVARVAALQESPGLEMPMSYPVLRRWWSAAPTCAGRAAAHRLAGGPSARRAGVGRADDLRSCSR